MSRWIVLALLLVSVPVVAEAAPHWEVDLSWTQATPTTQTGYHIQRRLGLTGTWDTLTTTPLAATARTYTDVGPYADGQVICHRVVVQPQNPNGSNMGAESCSPAPIQYPGQPSVPGVQWRWVP